MGNTPAYAFPYPEDGDLPDGAGQVEALARAVDSLLAARDYGGQMNVATNIPSGAGSSTTVALTGTPALWGGVLVQSNAMKVPAAGLWHITLNGTFTTNGSGTIRALWAWMLSGDNPAPSFNQLGQAVGPLANTTGIGTVLSAAGVWRLAAGDSVRAVARQDSGATLTCNATLTLRYLHA
jgi:hypothetical protein